MSLSRLLRMMVLGLGLAPPALAQGGAAELPAKPPANAQASEPDYPLDKLPDFSATMVGGLVGNIDETRIYRSGRLMRTDMLDGKNYMVTNLDHYDTFAVLPDRCMHDASPALNTFPFTAVRPGNKVERNPLGTEMIDGHNCQMEEVTVTSPHGKYMKLKFWEATDLSGFPVKMEVYRKTGAPITITYKDIKIGKQDPALFVHPESCSPPSPNTKKKTKPISKAKPQK